MKDIFKMIEIDKQKEEGKKSVCIGVEIQIAGRMIYCPVSENCHSYEDVAIEVEAIQSNLEHIIKEAKMHFKGSTPKESSEFSSEMSPEQIWTILSEIQDESDFIERFNSLDDTRRKAVADHVITKCNVFSGSGSFFSARYNNQTGYME